MMINIVAIFLFLARVIEVRDIININMLIIFMYANSGNMPIIIVL